MNPKLIVVSLTASVLLSTGCAAKNRWFSRKDYSEVQDPFMEGSEVASTDADSGDTSGRAKLGGGSLASQSSGPKPITRPGTPASMASSSAPAGSSRATAAYPDSNTANGSTAAGPPGTRSLSGPALSDFLNSGGKTMPADQPAGSPRVASNLSDPRSAAQRPSAGGLSPAARAASMPTLEEEEASFSGYMQKQTASVNATAQKATNKVRETEETASDFASWASQQKAQWTQNGANAVETVKAAPTAVKSKVRAVSHEARTAVDEAAVDFMTSPEFDSTESSEAEFGDTEFTEDETETETAEPLLTKPAARTSSRTERSKSKAQPVPTADAEADFEFESPTTRTSAEVSDESNPFDNPFGFDEQTVEKPVAKPSTSKSKSGSTKSSRPTIDESFDMDSGWKPADMKRP
jgi:hypothetical protein